MDEDAFSATPHCEDEKSALRSYWQVQGYDKRDIRIAHNCADAVCLSHNIYSKTNNGVMYLRVGVLGGCRSWFSRGIPAFILVRARIMCACFISSRRTYKKRTVTIICCGTKETASRTNNSTV